MRIERECGRGGCQHIHAELQLSGDVNIFTTSAWQLSAARPSCFFLTASLPRRRAPYLWDAAFHSASGYTGAKQEGITPGKKRPGRGPCLEDQNARNFTGLALPLLNHPSHENIELMNALIQMLQVQASDREPEVAAGDVKLP